MSHEVPLSFPNHARMKASPMAKDGMDMFQHMLMRLYHNDGDARRHAFAACIAIGGGGHTQLHKELNSASESEVALARRQGRFAGLAVGRASVGR